jgi:cytoskeletal protein RodZ
MLRKLNPRRSPAMVVAVIALIAALGGSAIAAGGLTGTQKKQVRKISTKVFNSQIGGASVAHAGTADTATKATTATTATKATTATTATKATTADTATKAITAANAEKFDGQPSGAYQRKLKAGCLPPSSIAGLSSEGDVTCTSPVQAISATPPAGENHFQSLGNGLQLATICHDGGQVEMAFQNVGAAAANLNWLYGNGSTVSASGVTVASSTEQDFSFLSARIEGQFIWSVGNTVMTVNLHAFDGTTFCEVRGTAETANG